MEAMRPHFGGLAVVERETGGEVSSYNSNEKRTTLVLCLYFTEVELG